MIYHHLFIQMLVKDWQNLSFYTQSKMLLLCPTWKILNLFLTWKGHVQDFDRLLFTLVLLHESSLSSWSCKTCWKPSFWKTTQLRISELDIPEKWYLITDSCPCEFVLSQTLELAEVKDYPVTSILSQTKKFFKSWIHQLHVIHWRLSLPRRYISCWLWQD